MDANQNPTGNDLWFVNERIRGRLREGVDFGNGRRLAIAVEPDVTWIKTDGSGRVTAVYIKGSFGITIHARLQNGNVEILSASLDCLCPGGQGP
jgi:hypothetical protein